MHIHIPTTSDATDSKSRFKVFDIYLNGIYHGSARYSQLLDLHTQVKSNYSTTQIVEFPSKIFRITEYELLQRRRLLERYIHCLSQDRIIGQSDLFQDFMLACQQVSCNQSDMIVEQEIFLCNGKSKNVTFSAFDRTSHALEATCKSIGISVDLTYYFGLFLEYATSTEDNWKVLTVLTDFQCPYITLNAANTSVDYKFRLSIRRSFYSPEFLNKCLSDSMATNMIYIEAVDDIDNERLQVSEDTKQTLLAFKKKGERKKYVELLSNMKNFGYKLCESITHNDDVGAQAYVGGTEIKATVNGEEKIYPINKMRCWKIGILRQSYQHFFTFEFEYSRQKFSWVSIRGIGSILLAQCVCLAVDEYVLTTQKKSIRKPSDELRSKRPSCSLSPLKLTSRIPPGEDLHMLVVSNDMTRTESESSKDSEASIETNDTDNQQQQEAIATSTEQDSPPMTVVKQDHISSTPTSTSTTTVNQVKPNKKKSKKDKEEVLINPSFLCDDDL